MKRLLLICLAALSVVSLYSQIRLDRSDFADVNDTIARIYYTFEIDSSSVHRDSIINSALIFDDPTEFPVVIIDSLIYFPSSETDPEGVFEGSTCAFFSRDQMVMHLLINTQQVSLVGVQTEIPNLAGMINLVFADTLVMMKFPSNFEDVNLDQGVAFEKQPLSAFSMIPAEYLSSLSMFYDTVRFFMNIKFSSSFDEHGEIQFVGDSNQNGTFQYLRENRKMITSFDVQLRSKLSGSFVSLSNISFIADQLPMELPIKDTNYSHQYWAQGWKNPLLEIEYNTSYESIHNMTFRYAYLSYVNSEFQSKLKVYPNPANEYVNFYLEDTQDCTLFVFSTDGRLIAKQMIKSEIEKFDLSGCEPGIYIYQIFDKNNIPIAGGKFVKN